MFQIIIFSHLERIIGTNERLSLLGCRMFDTLTLQQTSSIVCLLIRSRLLILWLRWGITAISRLKSYQPYVTTHNNFLKINVGRLINPRIIIVWTLLLWLHVYVAWHILHVSNSCGKSKMITKLKRDETCVCI